MYSLVALYVLRSNASALLLPKKLDSNSLISICFFSGSKASQGFLKFRKPKTHEIYFKMGANSSKDEKKDANDSSIQVNEDGGFHVVEFHLPSASYGITFLLLLIAVAFLLYIAYRRCVVEPRKKRDRLPIWLAQLRQQQQQQFWDTDRFVEIRQPQAANPEPARQLPAAV